MAGLVAAIRAQTVRVHMAGTGPAMAAEGSGILHVHA